MGWILTMVLIVNGAATTTAVNSYTTNVSCLRAGEVFNQQVRNLAVQDPTIKGFYTCSSVFQ